MDAGWEAEGWNVTHAELLGLGLVPGRDHWIRRFDVCVCVCVSTYTMEHHSGIKKEEMMPSAATWMHPDNITLRNISQRKADTG